MKQALKRSVIRCAARRLDRAIEDIGDAIYDLAILKKKVSETEAEHFLLYTLSDDLGKLSRSYDEWLANATVVPE